MMFYSSLVQNIRYTHYHAIQLIGLGYIVSVFPPIIVQAWGAPLGQNINCCCFFFNAKKTLTSFGSHDLWLRGVPSCGAVPKRDSASVAVCETWCECKVREIFQQGVAMLFGSSGCVRHQCDICTLFCLVFISVDQPVTNIPVWYILFIWQYFNWISKTNVRRPPQDNLSSRASRVNNGRKYLVCWILHQCSAVHCFVMYL